MKAPIDIARGGRVVFVRLRSLGDTVLMTPALESVRRTPGWETTVVIEAPFDQVLHGNPAVDRLIVLPDRQASWRERLRTVRRLRRLRSDLIIDLHAGSTASLMTRLSRGRIRVGYEASRHAGRYNCRVPSSASIWGRAEVHTVEHQLAPLKHLGFDVDPPPPLRVPLLDEHKEAAVRMLEKADLADGGFVLLHPAAAFDTKRWEAEKFAQLADRLESDGIRTAFTAGPGEEELLDRIQARRVSSVAAVLRPGSLQRFIALTDRCRLYVGNDTGATHIASALKKPVVAIFGSSDWKVWSPWQTDHRLIKADLSCIPCPGYRCHLYDSPRCIRSIGVRPVLEAVRSLL